MSLTYRRIDAEDHWPEIIWKREDQFPEWFRAASRAWTPTFQSFVYFWGECDEVWGLFSQDKPDELLACVYLEYLPYIGSLPDAVNIHLSVLSHVPDAEVVRFFRSLKNQKALDGVRRMHGWLVEKNKKLRELAEDAGFTKTGLTMSYGSYGERVFKWIEVRG